MLSRRKSRRSILPGFGLTMGFTLLYVSLLVVIPLAGLFFKSATLSWPALYKAITDPDLIASLKLTFGLSLIAACINVVFGFIAAWTLVRYPFPGHRIIDGIIDLPFALPTAVSGITLATLYTSKGWLGKPWTPFAAWVNNLTGFNQPDHELLPLQISYSVLGMLIALIFIGLPFIVRTLQPALDDLDPEVEEAASSLGASRTQSFFRIVLPSLFPAILTGFSLSFARAVGEYGSVIFISSNIPGKTEITAHLIMKKLENNDEPGATTLGIIMLLISFAVLIFVNGLQYWSSRRYKAEAT